jgi:hypothetical protein
MTNMEAGDIGYDVPMLPIWPAGGAYAIEALDEMDTSSTDRLAIERRQREAFMSELGAPSPYMSHGEYATFGLPDRSTTSNDGLSERRPEFGTAGGTVVEPGLRTYYKMRAQDSGSAPPGYVTWVAQDAPDFAGVGYPGGSPAPVGAMVAGSAVVAVEWQE